MMYDTEAADCHLTTSYVDMTTTEHPFYKADYDTDLDWYDSVGEPAKIENDLYNFLCTSYGVQTNLVQTPIDNYYAYFAMGDPFPCKEALMGQTWAYMQSVPGVTAASLPDEMWLPYETFYKCSADWISTVVAYTPTYLASQLVTENPVFDSFSRQTFAFVMWFYAGFGLFWIHSTYPNYILGDANGVVTPYGESPVLEKLAAYDIADAGTGDRDPVWELMDEIAGEMPWMKWLGSDDIVGEIRDTVYVWDWTSYDWDSIGDDNEAPPSKGIKSEKKMEKPKGEMEKPKEIVIVHRLFLVIAKYVKPVQ
jgi:hypothetical protein